MVTSPDESEKGEITTVACPRKRGALAKVQNAGARAPISPSLYNEKLVIIDAVLSINSSIDHSKYNSGDPMQRKASAVWKGSLKEGKGSISAPGGALNNTAYSFTTRFEN